MKRLILAFSFSLLFFVFTFSQEAKKVDEVGNLDCENLMAAVDIAAQQFANSEYKKIYFVYYEGDLFDHNLQKVRHPKRREAFNRVRDFSFYLMKGRKFTKDKIVIVNGGYRKEFTVEIWFVAEDNKTPELTPTLSAKDVKYSKGKPFRVKDCSALYDNL